MNIYKAKEIIDYHNILIDNDKSRFLDKKDKEMEHKAIDMAIQALDFVEFVVKEIFANNKDINDELFKDIACRKLNRLGLVDKTCYDKWELRRGLRL